MKRKIMLLYHWFNYRFCWFFSPHKPELELDMYYKYEEFKRLNDQKTIKTK